MKYLCCILIFNIFITACSQNANNKQLEELLQFFDIDTTMEITNLNVIVEDKIPYDAHKKEVGLFKFTNFQKRLISDELYPLNKDISYGAYLYIVENRLPGIMTFVIYTESSFGNLTYLVNFKDTLLVDFLYNDGNYGYPIEQTSDKEIIEGFDQRFEFKNDTVFKIKNRIITYDYYNIDKQDVEFVSDSVISIFKIDQDGRFKKIHYDSIPYPTRINH